MDGVVRGTQRGDLAPGVDRVPDPQLLADVLRLVAIGVKPAFLDPARSPLLHRGVEVQLEVGIREHDGADVPPRHDDPAGLGELPLALQQRLAHLRDARDRGHVPVDDRAAGLVGGVDAVEEHPRQPARAVVVEGHARDERPRARPRRRARPPRAVRAP